MAERVAATPEVEGFRGPQVCALVGITYRQLDYWARTGLLRPSMAEARGSGTKRVYAYRDLLELKVIKQLLDAGVSLQSARRAVDCLREDLGTDLASANLVLTGTRSVLAKSNGEVVDLLAGGQGVFNIVPMSGLVDELQAAIVQLGAVRAGDAGQNRTPVGDGRRGASRRGVTVPAPESPGRGWHPSEAPAARVQFAHPSERLFAALLDVYGIRWEYEPVEFALQWDDKGAPRAGFRPDFWLPEHRCFVELTTADQRLVTKKNGKVRRLRELYPEVHVMVVYQRDFLALLERHGLVLTASTAA